MVVPSSSAMGPCFNPLFKRRRHGFLLAQASIGLFPLLCVRFYAFSLGHPPLPYLLFKLLCRKPQFDTLFTPFTRPDGNLPLAGQPATDRRTFI